MEIHLEGRRVHAAVSSVSYIDCKNSAEWTSEKAGVRYVDAADVHQLKVQAVVMEIKE